MTFYSVKVLEWVWNDREDKEDEFIYEFAVQAENEEQAEDLALELGYREAGTPDNELIVREVEEFEIKTDKADTLGFEIKLYEGKDVYYSDTVQALIEYAVKLEKLVLDNS